MTYYGIQHRVSGRLMHGVARKWNHSTDVTKWVSPGEPCRLFPSALHAKHALSWLQPKGDYEIVAFTVTQQPTQRSLF